MTDEDRVYLLSLPSDRSFYPYCYGRLKGAVDLWLRGLTTTEQLAHDYHQIDSALREAQAAAEAGHKVRVQNLTGAVAVSVDEHHELLAMPDEIEGDR